MRRGQRKVFFSSSRLAAENLLEQLVLGLEQGMVTRPPELHVFASWEGFLAATAAAEASAEAGGAETEKQEQAPRATDDANVFAHYLLPPLRLVAHPHTESTLPQLLLRPVGEAVGPQQLRNDQRGDQQQQKHQQLLPRAGVLLAVGPEGGWIPSEMELLQKQLRCLPFRLTDKVLKCETALTACLTQLTLCYEDPMFLPLLRSPDQVYAAAPAPKEGAATGPGGAQDPGIPSDVERSDTHKRQGEREMLKAPGGFVMSFPRRYRTCREAEGQHQQEQLQQQQDNHESA